MVEKPSMALPIGSPVKAASADELVRSAATSMVCPPFLALRSGGRASEGKSTRCRKDDDAYDSYDDDEDDEEDDDPLHQ